MSSCFVHKMILPLNILLLQVISSQDLIECLNEENNFFDFYSAK